MQRIGLVESRMGFACTIIFPACLSTKNNVQQQACWHLAADIKYKEHIMYTDFYGSITVDNDTYTELIESIGGGGDARYIDGKKGIYNFKVTDTSLTINGVNNNYNEVWKRVK